MMWHLFVDKSDGCRLWQKGNQLLGDTKKQRWSSLGYILEDLSNLMKKMQSK